MDKISIVTGGGSGIGKAIAVKLAKSGRKVLIVGRRENKLQQTQTLFPDQIQYIRADVADEKDRIRISENVGSPIEYLIHNAALLGEITHLKDITFKEWQKVMSVNVDAPLFLTNILLDKMMGTRILHISSGAAHYAIEGWGAYCTSKAALLMICEMFKTEIPKEKAVFGSVKPGIVDTEMQELIRKADLKKMPHLQKFHDLFNQNKLETLDKVSKFLYWILTETGRDQFSAAEWDIRDVKYLAEWDV